MSHFLTLVIGDEPEKQLATLPLDTLLTMYDCHI